MRYFPLFLKFDNRKILVVGGGNIAYTKLLHLLDFTQNITVIAKEFSKETLYLATKHKLLYKKRDYEKNDAKGFDIVVAAIDNIALQEAIYYETREYFCLYNCVDLQKYCDFIFPSYVKKGDLLVAISTNGVSPAFTKQLRIYLEKLIPNEVIEFLQQMKKYRNKVPKGEQRMKFLQIKAKEHIQNWSQTDEINK